ncbi:MAG: M56 family metallopeptidase [bacterium]
MIFILKTALVLSLFYAVYRLLLHKETFHESNRYFLLFGLISAFVIPLFYIKKYVVIKPIIYEFNTNNLTEATTTMNTIDWTQIGANLYFMISLILLLRFLWQLQLIYKLIDRTNIEEYKGFKILNTNKETKPFSFFNYIVINPSDFSKDEKAQIIAHEKIHASQYHSIDLLLANIVCILLWFNPISWLYKKSLEQNLEYIADREAQYSISPKTYQYTLLKTAVPNYQMALTNNFFNSLIKKRIMMLNKQKSKTVNHFKMLVTIPLIAIFLVSFNVKAIPVIEESPIANEVYATPLEEVIVITKEMSDDQLDAISEKMKANNITLKFKNVKRNKAGDIIKISISAKSKSTTTNVSQNNDDGIDPITIKVDGSNISIGDGKHEVHDEDYSIHSVDNKVKIFKSGDSEGAVFIYSDSEDNDHEVIEEEDKIIIKRNGKVHEIKKGGTNSFILESDDDKVKVIREEKKIIIKDDKDGKVSKIHFKHNDDADNIWITEDADTLEVRTLGNKKNKFKVLISEEDDSKDKKPLFIVDGKEVKNGISEDLDPKKIESLNVLKGESAMKKYGDKGKNGVIEIITKKD